MSGCLYTGRTCMYKDNKSTCTLLTACVGCIRGMACIMYMHDSNDKTNHVVYLIAMKTRCSERGLFTPSHTQMQEWKERAGKGKRERRKEGACTTLLIMEAHGTRATQTRTHAACAVILAVRGRQTWAWQGRWYVLTTKG